MDCAPRADAALAKLFLAGAVRRPPQPLAGSPGSPGIILVERIYRDALALAAGGGAEVTRSVVAGALLELG